MLQALSLEPFEPMFRASIHHLTIKTVFLVAIASGHRVSTLQALSVDPGHVRWEPSGVRLIPRADFIAKNQSSSSPPVEIFLPSLSSFSSVSEDKVWCPVRALRWYLDKMKPKRSSSSLLPLSSLSRLFLDPLFLGGLWSALGKHPMPSVLAESVPMTLVLLVRLGLCSMAPR